MSLADLMKEALDQKGVYGLKNASKLLGISPELLRVTLNKNHIPKDKTIGQIAQRLGLDRSVLILAAHQQKMPEDVKGFLLPPSRPKAWREKRKFPISAEQTEYLGKLMDPLEIQMIRKYRQVTDEAKTQINGYVEYMFASQRSD